MPSQVENSLPMDDLEIHDLDCCNNDYYSFQQSKSYLYVTKTGQFDFCYGEIRVSLLFQQSK
jgi:hypothetical protein